MTFSASGGNRRAHRCHALLRQDHHDHGNVEVGGPDDHRCAVLLWHDHHGGKVEDGDHGDEVKDPKLENVRMEVLR